MHWLAVIHLQQLRTCHTAEAVTSLLSYSCR